MSFSFFCATSVKKRACVNYVFGCSDLDSDDEDGSDRKRRRVGDNDDSEKEPAPKVPEGSALIGLNAPKHAFEVAEGMIAVSTCSALSCEFFP